jgi:hypothetical protein
MNTLKYITGLVFFLVIAGGCKKTTYDDVSFVANAKAPDKLSVVFEITQDNTGLVTITPAGEGVAKYEVFYGDGTVAPAEVMPGKNTQHTYREGVFPVKIVAHGVSGKTTEFTEQLTVTFRAPENLVVSVTVDPANNFKVNVSATALYETNFRVYFGTSPTETPVSFLEGQTVSNIYTAVGTYNVRVVALSGGVASAQLITPVTIVDPLLLPITFESTTINYNFGNFDGGVATVISNPQSNGINTSAKAGRMVKNAGQPFNTCNR